MTSTVALAVAPVRGARVIDDGAKVCRWVTPTPPGRAGGAPVPVADGSSTGASGATGVETASGADVERGVAAVVAVVVAVVGAAVAAAGGAGCPAAGAEQPAVSAMAPATRTPAPRTARCGRGCGLRSRRPNEPAPRGDGTSTQHARTGQRQGDGQDQAPPLRADRSSAPCAAATRPAAWPPSPALTELGAVPAPRADEGQDLDDGVHRAVRRHADREDPGQRRSPPRAPVPDRTPPDPVVAVGTMSTV